MSVKHPQHWTDLPGPHEWFQVWHPPHWVAKHSEEWVALHLPEEGGVLTLCSFWLDETPPKPVSKVLDLEMLFPKRRKVAALPEIAAGDESLGFRGESQLPRRGPWWKRIWQRQEWQRFRVWCLRSGPVYVLALFQPVSEVDPEAETLASLVVRTLQFSSRLPCPPEVFSRRVVEFARERFPELTSEAVGEFELQLGQSRISLTNFYRAYAQAPSQFEEILLPALTTIIRLENHRPGDAVLSWERIRERVMPLLCVAEKWQEQFPTAVGREWVGGLAVLYVVDEKNAYWHIPQTLMEQWDVGLEELDQKARANLDGYFERQPMEFTLVGDEAEGPRLLLPVKSDLYNTSRLLSESFHAKLRTLLGQEFAVGAPCRDFFVGVSLHSPETLNHVRRKVGEDFHHLEDPLSDQLLLVTHDGVSEYSPWV